MKIAKHNLVCDVKSCTAGFIICIVNCPIIWSSELLQLMIAHSIMESEYLALSDLLKFLLLIQNLVKTVAKEAGLEPERLLLH